MLHEMQEKFAENIKSGWEINIILDYITHNNIGLNPKMRFMHR